MLLGSFLAVVDVGHLDILVEDFGVVFVGVELLAEDLLVLLDSDNVGILLVGDLLSGVLELVGVLHDVVGADVAAGDGSVEVLLVGWVPSLVDCHRASGDGVATIEGWLPGLLVVPCVSDSVVDDRVQVTDLARPGVHLAVWLGEGVPGGLSGSAVFAVEQVRVDGEAVFAGRGGHLLHVALDLHGCEPTALSELEVTIWVGGGVGRVPLHLAVTISPSFAPRGWDRFDLEFSILLHGGDQLLLELSLVLEGSNELLLSTGD